MGPINFGPEWFWTAVLWLAGIGLLATVVGIVYLIVMAIKHISIVIN